MAGSAFSITSVHCAAKQTNLLLYPRNALEHRKTGQTSLEQFLSPYSKAALNMYDSAAHVHEHTGSVAALLYQSTILF